MYCLRHWRGENSRADLYCSIGSVAFSASYQLVIVCQAHSRSAVKCGIANGCFELINPIRKVCTVVSAVISIFIVFLWFVDVSTIFQSENTTPGRSVGHSSINKSNRIHSLPMEPRLDNTRAQKTLRRPLHLRHHKIGLLRRRKTARPALRETRIRAAV